MIGHAASEVEWRRPYRRYWLQPVFWIFVPFAAVFSVVGLYPLLVNLGDGDIGSALSFVLPTVWGMLMAIYASRLARAGIYTSSFGVRVRNI